MAEEENVKSGLKLNIGFNVMPYIIASVILIVVSIISYFPPLTGTILGKETTIYLIPLAIQMMLRFLLLAFLFIVLISLVLAVHVFLIVKIVSFMKQFKQSIDDLIEYIHNL